MFHHAKADNIVRENISRGTAREKKKYEWCKYLIRCKYQQFWEWSTFRLDAVLRVNSRPLTSGSTCKKKKNILKSKSELRDLKLCK